VFKSPAGVVAAAAFRPGSTGAAAALSDEVSPPNSGLFEEDQVGFIAERLRETNALQHALGKIAQAFVAVRSESYQVKQSGNALAELRMRHAIEPTVQLEKLGGSESWRGVFAKTSHSSCYKFPSHGHI
jgi:hypothetical protein